jgi:hypothetical protein
MHMKESNEAAAKLLHPPAEAGELEQLLVDIGINLNTGESHD